MKIGILTFVHTTNYGALFQAYALQQTLLAQGADCELISYTNPGVLKNHIPRNVFRRPGLMNKLVAPMQYCIYRKRLAGFLRFEQEHLRFSPEQYDRENAASMAERFDRIVVGSDQVWNSAITDGDRTFFLAFPNAEGKRYSYAASTGTSYFTAEEKTECEALLQGFDLLSTREQTTAKCIAASLRSSVSVDIDPVFLQRRLWKTLAGERPSTGDYIFCYLVPDNDEIFTRIRRLAALTNSEIIWVRKGIKGRHGVKVLNTLTPEQFLSYISHAKYVVAGSFHAMCFSVIFHTDFYYTQSSDQKRTVRILDLLDQLGLQGRELPEHPEKASPINWESADAAIEHMYARSMETVLRICADNDQERGRICEKR